MKKLFFTAWLTLSVFSLSACSSGDGNYNKENLEKVQSIVFAEDKESDEAKNTVKQYFEYLNEKDEEKLLSIMTEKYAQPNVDWNFKNLKDVKALKIEEDTSENSIKSYLESLKNSGNEIAAKNIKVFLVEYEINYINEDIGAQSSGTYTWNYYVIRKDENSPWLIDNFGI